MSHPMADAIRRPFAWRAEAGAQFAIERGVAVVESYGAAAADEAAAARRMGLADLSPLPRAGFKGRDALGWLAERGMMLGELANQAYRQADGLLVAKLAATEVLLLPDPLRPWDGVFEAAWADDGRLCYPVPRRDGSLWFRVTGADAPAMFAKLCGVDLRLHRFAPLAVAQTSIARMSGIVIRDDLGDLPAWHLLADSASAAYLWRCLMDAMAEFGGRPFGRAALALLAGR